MKWLRVICGVCFLFSFFAVGCARIQVNLFGPPDAPLQELLVREGEGRRKIAMIPVTGMIAMQEKKGNLAPDTGGSLAVSMIRKAAADPDVAGLLLRMDSPGGTVTASDLLYQEILNFRKQRNAPVVAVFLGTAASGAYYAAMAADRIWAHPYTVTGSVGVIFIRPDVAGLMEKMGVEVEAYTSGRLKDMGSPFREKTDEEARLFDGIAQKMGSRFVDLVAERRSLTDGERDQVASARIFMAEEALALHLVDRIGYMDGAVTDLAALAGLAEPPPVVSWGYSGKPDLHLYSPLAATRIGGPLAGILPPSGSFCYLWPGGLGAQ